MKLAQSAFALFCLIPFSGGGVMSGNIDVTGLCSPDIELCAATAAEVFTLTRAAVQEALRVLKDKEGPLEGPDPRRTAFRLLSGLRASEAVPQLILMLDVRETSGIVSESRPITIGDHFPAAGALVRIGKPAVETSLWELTKDYPKERREKLCWIIGAIEGREVGRFIIEKEIRKLEEETRKARLRAALSVFDELFPAEADQKKW